MNRRHFFSATVAFGTTAALASGVGGTVGHALGRERLDDNLEDQLDRRGQGEVRVVYSVVTDRKAIALTFDDGPEPELTPQVLEILEDLEVPATFFMIGANAAAHPSLARSVADAGHEVANHSYGHPSVATASADDIINSVLLGGRAIETATGQRVSHYRPPRGQVTGAIMAGAASAGHDVVLWTVARGGPSIADDDTAGVVRNVRRSVHAGAIVCLHDGYGSGGMYGDIDGRLRTRRDSEVAGLSDMIRQLRDDGWTFHTVRDLRRLGAD